MTTTKAALLATLLLSSAPVQVMAIGQPRYIETTAGRGRVPLVDRGAAAPIVVDAADWPGVRRAATDLQADIARVTGITPKLVQAPPSSAAQLVIVGTIGRSPLIDRLVRERKIDVQGVAGKWESFVLQTVDRPDARHRLRHRDRRKRQARDDLRDLRPVRADWRLALVLVG